MPPMGQPPSGPAQQNPQPGPPAPGQTPGAIQGNPLAKLAGGGPQAGGGGKGSLLMMIMAFLAGNGVGPFADNIKKLMGLGGRGALGGNVNASHKPQGVQVSGSPNPGVTATPSVQGGQPPGGAPPGARPPISPQAIAQLLAQRGGQG